MGLNFVPPLICLMILGKLVNLYLCFLIYKILWRLFQTHSPSSTTLFCALEDLEDLLLEHSFWLPVGLGPWVLLAGGGKVETEMCPGAISRCLVPSRQGPHGCIRLSPCPLSYSITSSWILESPLPIDSGGSSSRVLLCHQCSFTLPILLSQQSLHQALLSHFLGAYHPFLVKTQTGIMGLGHKSWW